MIVAEAVLTCCHEGCGIVFAVPSWWESKRREDHTHWYCPNGHAQSFSGQTEAEKLRLERDRLTQRIAQRDDEITRQRDMRLGVERRLNATRGVVTRIKNRVGHGVCPCCSRTFQDLQRHMKSKHAEYAKSDILEAAE